MDGIFSTRPFNLEAVLKFTDLDTHVKRHLVKVYATLLVATLVLSAGAAAGAVYNISVGLSAIGAIGCALALAFMAPTPANLNMRYAALTGVAFLQGNLMGPLVNQAVSIDPSIIISALLATTAIFACFTVSALLTKRRSLLFLGGYLSSALMAIAVMRLGSFFLGRGRGLSYDMEIYLGLLAFSGYVLVDTQIIVERAAAGSTDHINHAMLLFSDLVAILVRIVIIMMKKAEEDNKRKAEQDRRRNKRD